jgi:VTC domain
MPKLVFKRREKKFLLTTEQFENVRRKIIDYGMVYDAYCKNGSIYSIYNIYFDDDNNSVIRRSSEKPKPKFKEKFRMRSYVVPTDEDDVFLEIKRKVTGVVVKRRVKLTYAQAKAFINHGERPETDDYLVNQVLNEIEYYFERNKVKPALYLSYERIAFFGADDPDFRVTFDRAITTRRTDLKLSSGSYGEQLLNPDEVLMEIKISGAIPKWFADILAEEKIYMTSFSKYGNEYSRFRGHEFMHICDRKNIAGNQNI